MWRCDAQRSAASPDDLPEQLALRWVRQLPRLRPAWGDQPKMQLDAVYEPIVLGQRLFVGSSQHDSLTAFDTQTGDEVWRFFAEGPIRFAPLAWSDKVYFASDDGYLYCLHAGDGMLAWKFRGGPSDRKLLGNDRLISTWPARGAPVIDDGKLYFAAGIWPFMGIFLHALDAETGKVLWTNDGDGSIYIKQPHNTDSFAGVAPQGPLVSIGQKLLIPGGRSVPACYDSQTGKMTYYQLAENGKRGGGSAVAAVDKLLFNGGAAFDLATEKYLGEVGDLVVFGDGLLFDYEDEDLRTLDLATSEVKLVESLDNKGARVKLAKWTIQELSKAETPRLTALIKAGSRLYAGDAGRVLAFDLPLSHKEKAEAAWQAEIVGTPVSLVAADDKLFAVTLEGSIYCFGDAAVDQPAEPQRHVLMAEAIAADNVWAAKVQSMIEATQVREGHCLVWGVGTGGLVVELVRQTTLRIVVVEPDAVRANEFRTQLHRAGLGCDRVAVLNTDPLQVDLPPYLANLIAAESLPTHSPAERQAFIGKVFASLRPYGGAACLPLPADQLSDFGEAVAAAQLAGGVWKPAPNMALLIREGALPDSANWTHEHADAANTRVSKDKRVKAPLGLLWFGGPTHDGILPRHGHGPQPQVVDGRLFIEGVDMLRAMDIYTGRVLWEAKLPGLGALYNNTAHQPGANAAGTNYIATSNGIYVAYGKACLRLDPATGRRIEEFQLPPLPESKQPPVWGYLNVFEDYLVGGADPLYDPALGKTVSQSSKTDDDDGDQPKAPGTPPETPKAGAAKSAANELVDSVASLVNKVLKIDNDNFSASNRLVVMERNSGKVLWTATAKSGFRHNAVCIGGGRLYCIDRLSGAQVSRLKRRGDSPPHPPRLVVFDLQSGAEIWSTEQDVFGTWLSYSVERDVLIQAGRTARDTLSDEPKGMRAFRGADGSLLWESKTYSGPAMIHHDTILMASSACELLTGAPRMREHPLSGEQVEWTWSRNYGCNTPAASEHLLTFRSGAAGYLDFCNDGGTGNLGGFRSSCTNNLIVAGGLLNAPDYTRTCTCSYQNQTSLALVHMPEVETWTSFGAQTPKQPVRRVGINLGAPGDRKAADGTLWLEFPSVGGSSPTLNVKIVPEKPEWFRRHSSQVEGSGLAWVASSGAKGLTSLTVALAKSADQAQPTAARAYTIRLYFAEPDDVQPGERLFDVKIQGQAALTALDVVKEAGGRNRAVVKEFTDVQVAEELLIQLTPQADCKQPASILSGIEIQAENW